VKRKNFIKILEKYGFEFVRNGGAHDIYKRNGKRESVPRHNEISENLVNDILKRNNIPLGQLKPSGKKEK